MRKLLIILLSALAIPSVAQLDTVPTIGLQLVLQKANVELLHLKMRKAQSQMVTHGLSAVYLPETDLAAGNGYLAASKIIVQQVPVSAVITQVMLDSITNYIKRITEPGATQPPPIPSVLGSIDNVDPRNVYTGDWTQFNNAVFHSSTSQYTLVNGTVEVNFVGRKIEWWGEKHVNHGIVSVSIDGGLPIDVDCYAAMPAGTNNTQLLYTSPLLSPGSHKFKASFTGRKNSSATQTNYIHDRVNVIQ